MSIEKKEEDYALVLGGVGFDNLEAERLFKWLSFAAVSACALMAALGFGPFLGFLAMVGTVLLIGPAVARVLGAAWPYLRVALIVGGVIAFLFPFVKGALSASDPVQVAGGSKVETGIASIYTQAENTGAPACLGRGSKLDDHAMVAAHKTLPCGSKVLVTNTKNHQSVVVTIVDRGPYVGGRVIDLTKAAAARLGFSGLAPVRLEVVS